MCMDNIQSSRIFRIGSKSEPKVSALSIVRKLKQESTNRLLKTQKEYLKKYYWDENTLWNEGYFASTIGNVSKEPQNIIYGIRVEVDAYIP
jgi:putative transposase